MPIGFKPGAASVRIREGWYAPVGGLLLAGAGGYALLGFPLDDVWHRLFGQDVTLWGPTHLMLIGGAGLSLVGLLVLEQEGRAGAHRVLQGGARIAAMVRRSSAAGGMLIGLSVFQGEFDFGVPQFRLVEQPALIAAAAGVTLVAARLWSGRGAALAAVAFFLVIRGGSEPRGLGASASRCRGCRSTSARPSSWSWSRCSCPLDRSSPERSPDF